jgi:hypothetical protein
MPGPGNTKEPSKQKVTTCDSVAAKATPILISASEIGKFCNPAAPSAFTTIHNDLLHGLLLNILEKGQKEGYEQGRSHRYDEGYDTGLWDSPVDDFFEKLKEEDEKRAQVDVFEEGVKNGEE